MNVLWMIDHVCYDGSLHGGGRLFMNLAPKLADEGVNVFPYFLRSSDEVEGVFEDSPLRPINLDRGKYDPFTFFEVLSLCRKHDIDVLHLYTYACSTFGRMAGKWLGKPTVIHDFDTQIYFPYPFYLAMLDRMLAGSTGRGLNASEMCRDYMVDVRNVPRERTELLLHAIPEERLARAEARDRSRARAELGWADDEIVFCCVTKLGPERGNDVLLEAFARVLKEVPRARLVLVYKPTYYHRIPDEYKDIDWIHDTDKMKGQLEAQARELGVLERLDLVESLDDPTAYLEGADAAVAPFLNERFSSVNLVESLAFGLPSIATDLGEQHTVLAGSGSERLIPAGDAAALAAAMVELARDPELRAAMSIKARERSQDFTLAASARRLARLYADLQQERAGK